MNLDRPILVYSNFCGHSKKFIDSTLKNPELYNAMIRMNIDVDPQTKQRPMLFYKLQEFIGRSIQRVPTVVTKNGNDLLVLSDKEAFKWLDFHIQVKNDDCTAFNPLEMVKFSDEYANFNSTKITDLNDAKEQSFKFLKDKCLVPDNIINSKGHGNQGVPQENSDTNVKQQVTYKQTERDKMDANLKNMAQGSNKNLIPQSANSTHTTQRIPGIMQRQQVQQKGPSGIDFTNPNFGLAGRLNQNTKIDKTKDLDMRLQQLMNDRERL